MSDMTHSLVAADLEEGGGGGGGGGGGQRGKDKRTN